MYLLKGIFIAYNTLEHLVGAERQCQTRLMREGWEEGAILLFGLNWVSQGDNTCTLGKANALCLRPFDAGHHQ